MAPHGSPGTSAVAKSQADRECRVSEYIIKLYVTGRTPRSVQAIANLSRICDEELSGRYELVVIDVLERPQLAEDEKIHATPTVVKELPVPIRRIIGDLSDRDRVLVGLDLRAASDVGGATREGL
jgi:circadian clock protein KaiB